MESPGVAGSIQISGATYELIRDDYVCEPRGPIQVKGKNEMETYFLLARRSGGPDNQLSTGDSAEAEA